MANVDPGAAISYAPPTIPTSIAAPPSYQPPAAPAAITPTPTWNPQGPSIDPGMEQRLNDWGHTAPTVIAPTNNSLDEGPKGVPGEINLNPGVPLESVYKPVSDARRRVGGAIDSTNRAGVPNSIADVAVYAPTDAEKQAQAMAEINRKAGQMLSDMRGTPGQGFNATNAVLGQNPFGKVLGLENALRAVGSGQSLLDIITVHADALIPGPGQGTLKGRFDKYVAGGMAPDQAANATMKDYGDALKTLAETDPGNKDSQGGGNYASRTAAQIARVLGLAQSITAPAPVPGSASVPLYGVVAGMLRKDAGVAAADFLRALSAAKVGDKVIVAGKEGVIDSLSGNSFAVKFAGDEVAKVVRKNAIEGIDAGVAEAAAAGPLSARIAAHEAGKIATAAPGEDANAALAAAKGAPTAPGTGSALKPGSTPAEIAAQKAAAAAPGTPPTSMNTPGVGAGTPAAAPATAAPLAKAVAAGAVVAPAAPPPGTSQMIAGATTAVRNAATLAKPALTSSLSYGAGATKAEVSAAEKRIIELQVQRDVANGKIIPEPPVTHGAGGNKPTRGFQIEKFPPEVQPFMAEIAKNLDPLLAGVTKPLSHEDITTAAQLIGDPVSKVASRLAKRGVTSADIQMVRQGVAAKTKVAMELATAVAQGQGSPKQMYDAMAALQEAAAIQATLHEATSEAGRVLGVLRTQIDPALAANPTYLSYMAAISRIAKSPQHAATIMAGLLQVGNDPNKVYALLRSLSKPTIGDELLSLWNVPRAVKASFDLSAAGRQGMILSVAHPQMAAEAFAAQIRAFRSESFATSIDSFIRTSPMQPVREKAGLFLAETGAGAQLSTREEAFLTRLTERVPGLAASGRAYVTYLNKLRADRFDDAILSWQKSGVTVSDDRARMLADWINIASGRGSFPQWAEGSLPLLNGLFFAPRFAVSRFQAVTFVPTQLGRAAWDVTHGKGALAVDRVAASRVAARDLVAFTGANVGLLAMASMAGAKVELDPRSPEFGKMRVGASVIDTWGGEQQTIRNVAQLITGQKKTVTGKNAGDVVPVARNEVVGRFLESKLSPSAGTAWDLGKLVSKADMAAADGLAPWDQPAGVDFVGQSFTWKELLTDPAHSLLIPMAFSDVIDAANADREAGGNGIRGGLLGSLSILGVGVTTYGGEQAYGQNVNPKAGPDLNPYHK